MPEAAFVLSPAQRSPIREFADTLVHELGLQGVPARVHTDGFPEPAPDRVYIWLDPGGYLSAEGQAACPGDEILSRTVVIYDEHRVPSADGDPGLEPARRAGAVFCLDAQSGRSVQRLGIGARVLRPGYSDALDRFDADAPRPIDVTFIGSGTQRRTQLLGRWETVLSRYATEVRLSDRDLGVDGKWSLLTQSKIALNIHCGEEVDLEWRRVIDAIHAGAVVVTEHSTSLAPLSAGDHLLVASSDSMPFVAENLLRRPERLARIRYAAYDRLRSWIPFALPVAVLRAALVELVGTPVAADSPRGVVGAVRGQS